MAATPSTTCGRSEALLMGTGTVWVWRRELRSGGVRSETPLRLQWRCSVHKGPLGSQGTWAGGPLDRQMAVKAIHPAATHSLLHRPGCVWMRGTSPCAPVSPPCLRLRGWSPPCLWPPGLRWGNRRQKVRLQHSAMQLPKEIPRGTL